MYLQLTMLFVCLLVFHDKPHVQKVNNHREKDAYTIHGLPQRDANADNNQLSLAPQKQKIIEQIMMSFGVDKTSKQ